MQKICKKICMKAKSKIKIFGGIFTMKIGSSWSRRMGVGTSKSSGGETAMR